MNHSKFFWPEMLARASLNRVVALPSTRANISSSYRWLHVSGNLVKCYPRSVCRVGTNSFGNRTEGLLGLPCSGGFLCSLNGARLLATEPLKAVKESATSSVPTDEVAALETVSEVGGFECSVHPLEELFYEGDTSHGWLQLLRGTCAGLPLPRQRIWGGSYREVIPTALPPPLALKSSAGVDQNAYSLAGAGKEGESPFSCLPDLPEGRLDEKTTATVPETAVSECERSSVPRELILGLLRAVGVTHLLPLQQFALPLLLQPESDVLLAAPAGTGKTLAAALAALSHLASEWRTHNDDAEGSLLGPCALGSVRALILTPTRDMAMQTRSLLHSLGRYTPLRVGFLSGRGPGEKGGGVTPWSRFSALLHSRPHVVVCTPGKAEELAHFLLAAEETGADKTGQVPNGITDLLSRCRLLVVEDASLQMQDPLMLRTVAKLKELLPADHKCIMLATSLSWDLQSCAARLMRASYVCLNCIEGPTPVTSAFRLSQFNRQQLPSARLPVCPETACVLPAVVDGKVRDKMGTRSPPSGSCNTAAVKTQGTYKAPSAGNGQIFSTADGHKTGYGARCDITAEPWADPCILRLEQPQVLWGPKRSGEFLAKKRCELHREKQGISRVCRYAIPGVEAGATDSSRFPDEFLLYPPELHGHFLFNVLAHEALLVTKEVAAATSLMEERPFRRVLIFFNSTKSLQFHYALFKHFIFPNIKKILHEGSVLKTCSDWMGTSRVSEGSMGKSTSRVAGDLSDYEAYGWPRRVPLPTLWALHSRLSSEKRRTVVEAFSSDSPEVMADGTAKHWGLKVLFCTDVAAVGVQLGPVALVLQIGAPKSVELYVQRAARAPRLARKLLALSDLDGHFLYECYKEYIPLHEASATSVLPLLQPNRLFAKALGGSAEGISYRSAVERYRPQGTQSHSYRPPDVAAGAAIGATLHTKGGNLARTGHQTVPGDNTSFQHIGTEGNLLAGGLAQVKPTVSKLVRPLDGSSSLSTLHAWEEALPLRASCELMYRSLLGMYSMQSTRLKFERWQVPSFINAMLLSLGVDEPPAVTKQMAARLRLMQAPGLSVDYHATSKTELLACLPACPGFLSRWRQLQSEGPLPAELAAAFAWTTEKSCRGTSFTMRESFRLKGEQSPTLPHTKALTNDCNACEQNSSTFAPVTLYPPRVPWALD